jgi:acetyltransferase
MQALNELTPEMLVRFTQIDYDREMAFIAVVERDARQVEVGVARYISNPDGTSCEFAIVVADEWHHRGIGTRLLTALIETAQNRGFEVIEGEVLSSNAPMLELVKSLGFSVRCCPEDPSVQLVHKELQTPRQ